LRQTEKCSRHFSTQSSEGEVKVFFKQLMREGTKSVLVSSIAMASTGAFAAAYPTVRVEVDWNTPTITVPSRFFGLNVGLGRLAAEKVDDPLYKELKPDAVRLQSVRRKDYLNNRTNVLWLSPEEGKYDFSYLDEMVDAVKGQSNVLLALGFGPPNWLYKAPYALTENRTVPTDADKFKQHMADVAQHYAANPNIRVSVDNEPERVGYWPADYFNLFSLTRDEIKRVAPAVKVGGPVIGWTFWKEPDGKQAAFNVSMQHFKDAVQTTDFVDWHVYTADAKNVIATAETVRGIFPSTPKVISEMNMDDKYDCAPEKDLPSINTQWGSVAWLSTLYDKLPQVGVDQAFYFSWRDKCLGLVDANLTELRPNYYVFWAMTRVMGRNRVKVVSPAPDDAGVGAFATVSGNYRRIFVYNKTNETKLIEFVPGTRPITNFMAFNKSFYDGSKTVSPGSNPTPIPWYRQGTTQTELLPAGGFVILQVQ
jgi:hypothetical protein